MTSAHVISAGHTIRRGGARLGRAVGNFFGVTDESAYGTSDQVGWAHVGERSAEETFTTSRRLSFRGRQQDEPPPEYPGELCRYLYTCPNTPNLDSQIEIPSFKLYFVLFDP